MITCFQARRFLVTTIFDNNPSGVCQLDGNLAVARQCDANSSRDYLPKKNLEVCSVALDLEA